MSDITGSFLTYHACTNRMHWIACLSKELAISRLGYSPKDRSADTAFWSFCNVLDLDVINLSCIVLGKLVIQFQNGVRYLRETSPFPAFNMDIKISRGLNPATA